MSGRTCTQIQIILATLLKYSISWSLEKAGVWFLDQGYQFYFVETKFREFVKIGQIWEFPKFYTCEIKQL